MSKYRNLSDQELAALLKQADGSAFAEIYERYWALLLRHAISMVQNEDEAKDVVQDVFQALWKTNTALEIHTSLSAFLYTSIRFRILKQLRHSKVAESYLATLQNEIEGGIPVTDHVIEEKELIKQIEGGLSKLPPKMREVFELSRIHEYSHRQISEKLNLSNHTVKRQISNALRIMRESINKGFLFFF